MSDVNKTLLQLSTFLPYRLSLLANRISRALADKYQSDFQISRPQWRLMAVLGEQPDLSAADLVEHTAMDKVAVSRAVKDLKNRNLLLQQPDPEDKRRFRLRLSRAGQATYAAIVPIAAAYEASILAQLNAREREQLGQLLSKLDTLDLRP
ncbi:MarR family winged helix-turn-helix transcriptional regulator [Reinekea sp.]|jgi:DNA-binding MarR family transcriptional regulator|uniref:MarR family winged helix-turn-helix transcriptional regulator n=1 Tax=Reinekea sp. TaxID=1970455 RepID=UPI002A803C4C|nr:MarR family winged helix-turn-helix transcriptional regulator [Reinekea sp.]